LRAHAAGVWAVEAAVALLIWHRFWLTRADFVDRFVTVLHADPELPGDSAMAVIDWPTAVAAVDAGRLPCSAGEAAVLRIAASLAGAGAVELGDAVTRLDEANLARVLAAVAHAGGRSAACLSAVPGGRVGW
jgi:hypothetical protein